MSRYRACEADECHGDGDRAVMAGEDEIVLIGCRSHIDGLFDVARSIWTERQDLHIVEIGPLAA